MELYSKKTDMPLDGYTSYGKIGLPSDFADLEFLKVRPREASIMVEGCFDEYVYLDFGGIGSDDAKSIILRYPSHKSAYDQTEELLWIEED